MFRSIFGVGALAIVLAAGCEEKPKADKASTANKTPAAPTKKDPKKDQQPKKMAPTKPVPQKAIQVNANLRTEEIAYQGGGVKMKGYLAYDKTSTKPRPGVLVVHEWWGHNDYVRKRARMLAEMGYTALAIDMYGEGRNTKHPDDAKKFMKQALADLGLATKRFEAAKKVLENHATTDPTKTAAIGYCFGGGVVLHMARVGVDLDGVASFHGVLGNQTKKETKAIKTKILVLNGAADPFTPAAAVKAFKEEMAKAKADLKFVDYPGAKHGFTNPEASSFGEKFKLPLAYDADVDKKSWQELELFLKNLFG